MHVTASHAVNIEPAWAESDRVAHAFLLGYGPATASAYGSDLRSFFAFCTTIGVPPLSCTRQHIDLYSRHLQGAQGLSAKTTSRRLTALSGYFSWAVAEEILPKNPMVRVRRPRLAHEPPPQTLDRFDIAALLRTGTDHSPRAAVLCHLLLLNALRISEVVTSDAEGLGTERGHRTLRITRKGSKVTRIALAPPTVAAIETYLAGRTSGPLLLSRTGRRLDRSNAARLLSVVGRAALAPDKAASLHPHLCRHAAITAFLDSGASLRDVQDAAGHVSASQTREYDDSRGSLDRAPTYKLVSFLRDSADD